MNESTALQVPQNDSCAFCAYLSGERPYSIVSVDDTVAIFVTREQRGLPHLLVIPVVHRETILDLSDFEATAVIIAVRQTAQAITDAYHRPGIAVWQNNGEPANQKISHVHFHVAGTLEGGGTEWAGVEEMSLQETDDIAASIRAVIGSGQLRDYDSQR